MAVRVGSRSRRLQVARPDRPLTLEDARLQALAENPSAPPGPRAWSVYWDANAARVRAAIDSRLRDR
jgi:hypothetical protein